MFTGTGRGSHFGSKLLKSATKISSLVAISRVFPWKFLQIHITSISGCLYFSFKICQTIAGTITISQFHEFLNLLFGGFLQYDSTVRRRRGRRRHGGSRHHIGNTHSCLLLYYILAEEELFSLLAAEMVSVEINVHDNASIVVIVLKIWWCPLWLLRLLLLRLHDGENLVNKSG